MYPIYKLTMIAAIASIAQSSPTTSKVNVAGLNELYIAPYDERFANETETLAQRNVLKTLINDCGDSTFVDQGSEASPYASDCETLAYNIRGDGSWRIRSGVQRKLASYGTCAFGAQTYDGDDWYAYVGNEDIRDVIRDSISKFKRPDGKIGAKGIMNCESGSIANRNVLWGIYHN